MLSIKGLALMCSLMILLISSGGAYIFALKAEITQKTQELHIKTLHNLALEQSVQDLESSLKKQNAAILELENKASALIQQKDEQQRLSKLDVIKLESSTCHDELQTVYNILYVASN